MSLYERSAEDQEAAAIVASLLTVKSPEAAMNATATAASTASTDTKALAAGEAHTGNEKDDKDDDELDPTGLVFAPRVLRPAPYFYYTDHSLEMDDDPLTPVTTAGRVPTFPAKMHAILANKDLHDIVAWAPHGRSWCILNPRQFEIYILPKYFEHSKFSSFVRQANGWGFRRLSQGHDRNAYFHEYFLRGMPWLCKKMRRPKVSEKKALDPDHEPDFKAISREFPVIERPPTREVLVVQSVMEVGPRARMPVQWTTGHSPPPPPDINFAAMPFAAAGAGTVAGLQTTQTAATATAPFNNGAGNAASLPTANAPSAAGTGNVASFQQAPSAPSIAAAGNYASLQPAPSAPSNTAAGNFASLLTAASASSNTAAGNVNLVNLLNSSATNTPSAVETQLHSLLNKARRESASSDSEMTANKITVHQALESEISSIVQAKRRLSSRASLPPFTGTPSEQSTTAFAAGSDMARESDDFTAGFMAATAYHSNQLQKMLGRAFGTGTPQIEEHSKRALVGNIDERALKRLRKEFADNNSISGFGSQIAGAQGRVAEQLMNDMVAQAARTQIQYVPRPQIPNGASRAVGRLSLLEQEAMGMNNAMSNAMRNSPSHQFGGAALAMMNQGNNADSNKVNLLLSMQRMNQARPSSNNYNEQRNEYFFKR